MELNSLGTMNHVVAKLCDFITLSLHFLIYKSAVTVPREQHCLWIKGKRPY